MTTPNKDKLSEHASPLKKDLKIEWISGEIEDSSPTKARVSSGLKIEKFEGLNDWQMQELDDLLLEEDLKKQTVRVKANKDSDIFAPQVLGYNFAAFQS